jgi:hypothetical protein
MMLFSAIPGRRTVCAALVCLVAGHAAAQREVNFPPANAQPPPAAKQPPRTQTGGETTMLPPGAGPAMRQTQERKMPPPTTLAVMYKVQYGEQLKYTYPDGRVQVFPQWQSYKDDGFKLMTMVNERLADGNNYRYAVKPLASPGFDPLDIPLLYMTGDYDFTLQEAEVENLRQFILDGGTILFNAARGRDEFGFAVTREMLKVFPQKRFVRMPPDHPVFQTRYRITDTLTLINGVSYTQPPELYSIDIGTRAAVILVPIGLGSAWSGDAYHPAGRHFVGESAVRMGVNLVAYVLGSTEYGRFLAQKFPVYEDATRSGDVFRYALARYAGSWDLHPGLQNTMLQIVNESTGVGVEYTPHIIDLGNPRLMEFPLVLMTGHYDFRLREAEVSNLRSYLRKGGTLLACAAAGFQPFDLAFRREIRRVAPGSDLIALPPSHPLFGRGWAPVDEVDYTPRALQDNPTLRYPEFYGIFLDHRLAIIYSPYGFFGAVNREPDAYTKGLTADHAGRIAINIVTHALSH